jgi:hypothetical protein
MFLSCLFKRGGFRGDVDSLIAELEQSIREADAFIKDMDAEAKSQM